MLVWISDLGMKKGFPEINGNPICGAKGIRTPDLLNAIQTRYQLRHNPTAEIYYIVWRGVLSRNFAQQKGLTAAV